MVSPGHNEYPLVYPSDSYHYGQPLGMEDHHIMDAQLIASSYTSSTAAVYPPWAARLHLPWTELGATFKGIWAAAATNEWIMVSWLDQGFLCNMHNVI